MKYITEIITGAAKQIYSLRRVLFFIYIPSFILFIIAGALVLLKPDLFIQDFLRDVTSLGDLPFYAGSISQLGLLLWSAATTLCLFTYFGLKRNDPSRKESLNFLLFAGLLSGYLLLDDAFLLHEELIPEYIKFMPEKAVILLLGTAMLAFLYFNRSEIIRNEYGLLALTYLFLGVSVFFDLIPNRFYPGIEDIDSIEYFMEDGAKFLAIVTWVTFFVRYSFQQFLKQDFQKT